MAKRIKTNEDGTKKLVRSFRYGEYGGPYPSQQAFHSLKARYKGFSGPVGSGKSNALVYEAIRLAYRNHGRTGLIAAPTIPLLRDSTQTSFLAVLEEERVPFRFFSHPRNMIQLLEPNSSILFRSMGDPERLRGTNLAWFAVDELTYCKEASWLRLEARLRDPGAKEQSGFACWTPKGYDWVYNRFIDPGRNEKLQRNYQAIRAVPGESAKVIGADYYERLRDSYDERFYTQEVLGEYLSIFSGQVYTAFDRLANKAKLAYDPRFPLIWALDFNIEPMSSVICQQIPDVALTPMIHVLDELVIPSAITESACEEFIARTAPWIGNRQVDVLVYGDPAGNSGSTKSRTSDWDIVRNFFRNQSQYRMTYRIDRSHPSHRDRTNSVNARLRNAAGVRRMLIDPRCEELMRDFEQVQWKADPTGRILAEIDKSDPKRTHLSDALGYYVWKEFPVRSGGTAGSQSKVLI